MQYRIDRVSCRINTESALSGIQLYDVEVAPYS